MLFKKTRQYTNIQSVEQNYRNKVNKNEEIEIITLVSLGIGSIMYWE